MFPNERPLKGFLGYICIVHLVLALRIRFAGEDWDTPSVDCSSDFASEVAEGVYLGQTEPARSHFRPQYFASSWFGIGDGGKESF